MERKRMFHELDIADEETKTRAARREW